MRSIRLKKKIERLQKRADFLDKRIAEAEADGRDLSFDKAERSALVTAIELMEKYDSGQLQEVNP